MMKHQKKPENIDCRDSLVEMLSFLTQEERVQLTAMLARKGVETILYLLNPENQALLELTEDKKRAALRMESISEKQFREILSKIEISTRETISEVDHSDTNIRARA
ncbi:hypothetical protein [Candidatus Pantoea persica]|uniref:hypothetical protein n=1 Tax=Candidatus Pantoea persica TaxID=2518128 RepID=UPI00215DB2D9|nr:hypothetical protein [Candidatus Pantoea persica]